MAAELRASAAELAAALEATQAPRPHRDHYRAPAVARTAQHQLVAYERVLGARG